MEIYGFIETPDKIKIDSNNEDNIDNVHKYYNDGLNKNSQFPTNEESYFLENKSVVLSNKDNPPDILMDTKEKEYMKLGLNTNTLIYHCKEDCEETVSKYKTNLEHRPASTSTSLDFITISEWTEQEDEERFRHHLANNPENPNFSCESTTKEKINETILKENGSAINSNDEPNKVNEEKENDQQKKVDAFDKNNELTHNDREAPFSNTSTSSKAEKNPEKEREWVFEVTKDGGWKMKPKTIVDADAYDHFRINDDINNKFNKQKMDKSSSLTYQVNQKRQPTTLRSLLFEIIRSSSLRNTNHIGQTFDLTTEENRLIHPHFIIKIVIIEQEGLVIDHLGETIFDIKIILPVALLLKIAVEEPIGLMECAGFITLKVNQPPVA